MTDQADLYGGLITEARFRIEAVERLLARSNMPPRIIEELCYLQLRLLCEVIALGCLVAHGDIRTRKMMRESKPGIIFKQLERCTPTSTQKPSYYRCENGGLHVEPRPGPWLSKDHLKTLWKKSGNELHRGNVARLLSGPNPAPVNLAAVRTWVQKIRNLLHNHQISSRDNKRHYLVLLSDADNGGNAGVITAASP